MTKQIQDQRCEGFDRQQTRPFSFPKIDIFRAITFAARSSIKSVRFCFPEIGGTNNRGDARSGTCSWRKAISFALISLTTNGRSMEFMTERLFVAALCERRMNSSDGHRTPLKR